MIFFLSPSEQQEKLVKQHGKLVVLFNHALERKAMTTIHINETYTKINCEKEETKLKKKRIQAIEEIMDKERGEYLKKKKRLSEQVCRMIYFFIVQNCLESQAQNGE